MDCNIAGLFVLPNILYEVLLVFSSTKSVW